MSRIGKKPIVLPEKVTVEVKDDYIVVKGPKGELKQTLVSNVIVKQEESKIIVDVKNKEVKENRALWGTYAALIRNMVIGVTEGFSKQLEINGVGYGWQLQGKKLEVKAGYSHPVEYELPAGIEGKVEKNVLTISGIDKQLVGNVAAEIRKIRKPEPYKGKGIKYIDEQIRRKAGKQAVGESGS